MYIYIAVLGNGVYNIKIKGMDKMPNIKPILDLRYYIEVRKEVSTNQPVYLIRNGRGAYAIVEVDELERLKAAIKLMIRLEEGEQSAREKGWLTADEVEAALGKRPCLGNCNN